MLISFIFSYSENIFVLFYPTFIFHSCETPAYATMIPQWLWQVHSDEDVRIRSDTAGTNEC